MNHTLIERMLLQPQNPVPAMSTIQGIQGEIPRGYPNSGNEEEVYERRIGGYDVSIPPYQEEDSRSDL